MVARTRSAGERRAAQAARRQRRSQIEDAAVVMEAAANFLAVRSRSVAETRRRLRHLGYPPTLTDEVVDELIDLKVLDDASFARAWVESRDRSKPRGEAALRRELRSKGISTEVIADVLADRSAHASPPAEGDEVSVETAAAQRLLDRRRSSLVREADPRRRRQKAYALLARNGFPPDVCQEVASRFEAEAEAS